MAVTASAEGPEGAGAAACDVAAGAASDFSGVAAGLASSTSAFTIRPRGPEPLIWLRSNPLSAAIRRARGDAKFRSPSAPLGAAGALVSEVVAGAGAPLPEPSPPVLSEDVSPS